MTTIQLLKLFFLFAAVYALYPETECPGEEVVVNYDTPMTEYIMSMTVEDTYGSSYGACGPWETQDLKKMLLGSHKMWKSTCKKTVAHELTIEPTVDYAEEYWTVQYLKFKVKGANKIEIYVDDQQVLSKPVGLYFTFSQEIMTSGKQLKVVIYPKWRFTCITLFDVEVIFCCVIPTTTTTTTTTTTVPTTTLPQTVTCEHKCENFTQLELHIPGFPEDGECFLSDEAACKSECVGTCFDASEPAVSQIGIFIFGTIEEAQASGETVNNLCQCCEAIGGQFVETSVTCRNDVLVAESPFTYFTFTYEQCECRPCNGGTATTTPEPYGIEPPYGGGEHPPYGPPSYGVPSHGYWPPYYPFPKWQFYKPGASYEYGNMYGAQPSYGNVPPSYGSQPSYGNVQPPYGVPIYGDKK